METVIICCLHQSQAPCHYSYEFDCIIKCTDCMDTVRFSFLLQHTRVVTQYVMEQLCSFRYSSSENTQWISMKFGTGSISTYSFLSLYSTPINSIKGQRISWLGHLERIGEDRLPKKIFTQELEGTRRMGRPRKRCEEEVERDLQVLGVRRWRELVADRKKWKDIVRQAKAHNGL